MNDTIKEAARKAAEVFRSSWSNDPVMPPLVALFDALAAERCRAFPVRTQRELLAANWSTSRNISGVLRGGRC